MKYLILIIATVFVFSMSVLGKDIKDRILDVIVFFIRIFDRIVKTMTYA